MAALHGKQGKVTFAGTATANVTNWTINATADVVECAVMSNAAVTSATHWKDRRTRPGNRARFALGATADKLYLLTLRKGGAMKVLFVGGTGVISEACTKLAADKGLEMVLLNRSKTGTSLPEGVRVIKGDISDPGAVKKALGGEKFDCVVDWIVYETEQLERDIA